MFTLELLLAPLRPLLASTTFLSSCYHTIRHLCRSFDCGNRVSTLPSLLFFLTSYPSFRFDPILPFHLRHSNPVSQSESHSNTHSHACGHGHGHTQSNAQSQYSYLDDMLVPSLPPHPFTFVVTYITTFRTLLSQRPNKKGAAQLTRQNHTIISIYQYIFQSPSLPLAP